MTRLMEEVLSKVAKLPQEEQDAIASWLLNELASDKRWQNSFEKSSETLASMANVALAEHRQRHTKKLDLERL
ncbi:MAG: hypothetical protein HYX90_02855 [Chloroflexi bacterium]|nr:hypothetical protein [Chloroflexota bacterium]